MRHSMVFCGADVGAMADGSTTMSRKHSDALWTIPILLPWENIQLNA